MGFETDFTKEFVRRSLPAGARRILEVGCGTGELAASLSSDGLAVVAIDCDSDSVAAAQRLGVDARVAIWPGFEEDRFDAVLFSRSLHHIHPLNEAVERAARSLVPNGRIIVEDFAYEEADERTLRWFVSVIDALDSANQLVKDDHFLSGVRSKTETLTVWRESHESDLHAATDIFVRIREVFGNVSREDVPYFFRYLAGAMVPTADSDRIFKEIAAQETAWIAERSITALGRRFVAVRR